MADTIQKVMLIDDNEIDNFVTRRVMDALNFTPEVEVMTSGRAALDFITENQNNSDKLPDIVFLDLNMPIVDGFLFLFEFDDYPDLVKEKCKIVVVSSVIEQSTIDKILRNEYVYTFIPKPLNEKSLTNLVNKIESGD